MVDCDDCVVDCVKRRTLALEWSRARKWSRPNQHDDDNDGAACNGYLCCSGDVLQLQCRESLHCVFVSGRSDP